MRRRPYTRRVTRADDSRGLALAGAAYTMWGVFPLYFHLLDRSGSLEIVAHRIVWTLAFCLVGVTVRRSWTAVRAVIGDARLFGTLLGAGVLVSLNWLIYVYAIISGHVVDASLGYFMNPLVTVALARVVLHETVRPAQAVALAGGLLAVVVIAIGAGGVPWIGLGLALTFGLYSLAKNRVGRTAPPLAGLGVEAMALTLPSLALLGWLAATHRGTFGTIGPGYTLLLAATGVVTAVPLLFFAAGAARLSLTSLGLVQYLTPVVQFALGVVVFHEHMSPVRWIGFALVWAALLVLTWDLARRRLRH